MLSTTELQALATKHVLNFDGVFPINQLPITPKKSYRLIINTDPDNLSGTHWIAIAVRDDKTAYVFDSFGRAPCNYIQNWLNIRNLNWSCNLRQIQPTNSELCGYYCTYFLKFIDYTPLRYEFFSTIVDFLFPKHIPLHINDNNVIDVFANTTL